MQTHTPIKLKLDTHKGLIKYQFWLESDKDLQSYDQFSRKNRLKVMSHLQGKPLEGIS